MSEVPVLPELELLRAKVLHQQLMIEELRAQALRQQMAVHEAKKTELIQKIKELRDRLAEAYDINLDTHIIMQDTGEVVPKDSVPDIKRLMENIAKQSALLQTT
jgi:uncharacterized protein with von Willebrand factor type A (vWA) domain